MPKPKAQKTVFVCQYCGFEAGKWSGMCTQCKSYNSFEECAASLVAAANPSGGGTAGGFGGGGEAMPLSEADLSSPAYRIQTHISELDRVLAGGLVLGSVVLIGGEPGVGKSTLLLQICAGACKGGKKILYVSGEESLGQIKMRADRINVDAREIIAAAETDAAAIEVITAKQLPDILLVDSIQTMHSPDIPSSPGSVAQVRECTARFIRIAKTSGICVILVGHVTKDGAIAGPKVLEHMVDTVLYFEGERHANYRIIRSVKNRFGPANEIGVFEMGQDGLTEILNPSEYMLQGRALDAPGSAVTALIEGSRPILIEMQALVSYTAFGTPRRAANGLDYNRAVMLIAVLEKRMGFNLNAYDTYLNIAGGLRVQEPAADLAAAAAIASSYKNVAACPYTAYFGEVGLTGEVRAVTRCDLRLREAAKFGFQSCIIPQANLQTAAAACGELGLKILGVANISEMMEIVF